MVLIWDPRHDMPCYKPRYSISYHDCARLQRNSPEQDIRSSSGTNFSRSNLFSFVLISRLSCLSDTFLPDKHWYLLAQPFQNTFTLLVLLLPH